ncbi:acid phosphatase type 7-like [Physella acuta]|uniref:acid phosphatase type 7-like n=1 Tax=Physella acuta TaxID=109671 RepID=UPI0027DAE0C9|nr:acid phosphatase type 7-like [Physella acuta]
MEHVLKIAMIGWFILSYISSHVIVSAAIMDAIAKCSPKYIHISYGQTTSEMIIMWSSVGQCSTAVKYGESPNSLTQMATGESRIFDQNNDTKVIHRVHLRYLSPGKTYFYKPSSNNIEPTGILFFETPSNKPTDEMKFIVISDVNASSEAIPILSHESEAGKFAAILHTGNIAMNLSTDSGKHGDNFMQIMEPAISKVPYMVSPGPDEVEDDNFSQYTHRFSLPETEWPTPIDKMWYSIDIGLVHLISYSTEVYFTKDARYAPMQKQWLMKDLTAANQNRSKVPWIVAFGHRPFYCTYEDPSLDCNKKSSEFKKGLEDIFYHYGVDIIIQSYGRSYERTYPMFKGVQVSENYTNPLGPVHIINGGASPYEVKYNFTEPSPVWSAFRQENDTSLSFGRLTVLNASIVDYEQISMKDGSVIDSFRISQEKHGQFKTETLSPNISAEIDKNIAASGGQPGNLNVEDNPGHKSKIAELLEGDNRNRIIIGASCAFVGLILLIVFISVRKCKRRSKVTRRWEQMDINYGKKFYNKAPDKEEDNDFEIDMSDGTEPTRKLLNADD